MSADPKHWIGTEEGAARPGNEDAFLWLGPSEIGEGSYLWLVVDGEGGAGVGDLAAGMLIVTVRELYPDLVDLHDSPLVALEIAASEANQRLSAIADVYPALRGVRASFAAAALHGDRIYTASAGSAAVFAGGLGEISRVGADDIAHSIGGPGDPDPVPGSGLCTQGPLLHPGGEPLEPSNVIVLLCTDGVTAAIPGEMLAQAAARLGPKDCVDALIELSRTRWSDDDATVAVVRCMDPSFDILTTPDAFLAWAEGGMTKWPEQTLVLQTGGSTDTGEPPRTNVDTLPTILGEPDPAHEDVELTIERTMAFSPEQVRAIVEASAESGAAQPARANPGSAPAVEPSPAAEVATETAATPADPEAARGHASTMAFSPADLETLRAAADAKDVSNLPFASTSAFGTAELDSFTGPSGAHPAAVGARASEGGSDAPTTEGSLATDEVVTAPPPTADVPVNEGGSTMFFSPQQLDEVRSAATAAPRASSGSKTAEVAPGGTVVLTPQTNTFELPNERTGGLPRPEDISTLQSEKLQLGNSNRFKAAMVLFVILGSAIGLSVAWFLMR